MTLNYGTISLLRSTDYSIRTSFPLINLECTFGRLSNCDCRIVLPSVSKLHAKIVINSQPPFLATLQVHSINGLIHNDRECFKGEIIDLRNGDLIIICERIFRFESSTTSTININSPTLSRRLSLLQTVNTPIKAIPVISPMSAPSPVVANTDLIIWDDEEPAIESDGVGGDLITWEEVEEVVTVPVEDMIPKTTTTTTPRRQSMANLASTPALADRARSLRLPASAKGVPSTTMNDDDGTPTRRRRSMRMTIVPSERRIDFNLEREALLRERESALQHIAESPPVKSLTPSTPIRISSTPSTPSQRSTPSTPRIASANSSTSRRISALLVLTPRSASSHEELSAEEQDDEDDGDSSEEEAIGEVEGEVEAEVAVFDDAEEEDVLAIASSIPLPDSPLISTTLVKNDVTPSRPRSLKRLSLREKVLIRSAIRINVAAVVTPIAPSQVESDSDEEEEEEVVEEGVNFVAASPSVTPIKSIAVQPKKLTPGSGGRKDSLDLIRSARSVAAFNSPIGSPSIISVSSGVDDTEEDVEEEELGVIVTARSISRTTTPTSNVVRELDAGDSPSPPDHNITPCRPIAAKPRVSLSERSKKNQILRVASAVRLPETPVGESSYTPKSVRAMMKVATPVAIVRPESVALPETPVGGEYSYTPKPTRTNVTPVAAIRPESIALPETPIGAEYSYTPKVSTVALAYSIPESERSVDSEEEEDEDEESMVSSEDSLDQDRSPVERVAFQSEMTSPVNHHRLMATPRSVLRPIPATFPTTLSVSLSLPRQLFSYALGTSSKVATPATNKRKVAFNDEVYIQEIVDIRDKRMHWDARVDEEEVKKAARIPLPVSPAPVRMATPRRPATPARVVPSTPISLTPMPSTPISFTPTPVALVTSTSQSTPVSSRKAQRVLTATPAECVRKVMMEGQVVASPRRVANRTPTAAASGSNSTLRSPVKAVSSSTPVAITPLMKTPTKATRVVVEKVVLGDSPVKVMRASRVTIDTPVAKKVSVGSIMGGEMVRMRAVEIQKLLEVSTTATPSSRPVAPKSERRAPSTSSASIAATKSVRRSSMPAPPPQRESVIAVSVIATPTPISPCKAKLPTTPVSRPVVAIPVPAKTPNFNGIRTLFNVPSTSTIAATPKFTGIRTLFNETSATTTTTTSTSTPRFTGLVNLFENDDDQKRQVMKTPKFTGVKEMMMVSGGGGQEGQRTPRYEGVKEMMEVAVVVVAPAGVVDVVEVQQNEEEFDVVDAASASENAQVELQEEIIVVEPEVDITPDVGVEAEVVERVEEVISVAVKRGRAAAKPKVTTVPVKRVSRKKVVEEEIVVVAPVVEEIEVEVEVEAVEEVVVKPTRGRGRPAKVVVEQEAAESPVVKEKVVRKTAVKKIVAAVVEDVVVEVKKSTARGKRVVTPIAVHEDVLEDVVPTPTVRASRAKAVAVAEVKVAKVVKSRASKIEEVEVVVEKENTPVKAVARKAVVKRVPAAVKEIIEVEEVVTTRALRARRR